MRLEGAVVFCVLIRDDHFVAVKLKHLQYLFLAASQILYSPSKNFCVGFKFFNKKSTCNETNKNKHKNKQYT